ncbi:MAG: hypothetical protein H0U64_02025 [Gemmatimonadaceae bacterium]|nr:hypothetical protein [Gemmatimonadaceae bacterium]
MAALTANRDTLEMASAHSQLHSEIGTDATQYYKGGIICVSTVTGKMVKGTTATTLIAIGRCEENVLTGTSNTREINARSGTFKFGNSSAADLIAADDIGKACYIVDDQTVALTDGTGTRSRAGIIEKVAADGGVYVNFTTLLAVS